MNQELIYAGTFSGDGAAPLLSAWCAQDPTRIMHIDVEWGLRGAQSQCALEPRRPLDLHSSDVAAAWRAHARSTRLALRVSSTQCCIEKTVRILTQTAVLLSAHPSSGPCHRPGSS